MFRFAVVSRDLIFYKGTMISLLNCPTHLGRESSFDRVQSRQLLRVHFHECCKDEETKKKTTILSLKFHGRSEFYACPGNRSSASNSPPVAPSAISRAGKLPAFI